MNATTHTTSRSDYVHVANLTKRFGNNTVFEGIEFSIEQGEFVTLLGPSGCGKSTLLRSLAGLNPVDDGEIWVNGENITNQTPQQRGIGMVFQSYALFPNMTVAENIAFGLKMQGQDRAYIKREVQKVVELVSLIGKEKHYPNQLSGGQRQRVALARALVVKPRILLLDEPLSALDAKIRKHLRQQIRDIQKELNLTTVFVTHDQEEAMILSDRIFLMHQGEIVQQGSPESIYTQPANEFVAGFMGHYNLVEAATAKQLFNIDTAWKVAIRPESIYVKEAGRSYGAHVSAPQHGTIKHHQLLGNVIRYHVDVRGCELTVDLLNRSSERLFATGSQLELLFNLNEIQPVRA
ncbi:ABC transporter ATP-binding protein [Vibrio qinghaiensis]|uniref:ABC transporter ATP-binding protein n=1 Tax=Vibrio qinghaiensis TaxID=2025808 RepID=A0A223N1L0_9VIBR|nr:ABC transporter ATP-binding protein [Vibrio qinghaiensis]ASU23638.1 ABC transporter ATP-binding protein [Vibrio qinghaiensis]